MAITHISQIVSTGFGVNGGTTGNISTLGANCLIASLSWFSNAGAIAASLVDSEGNTWTPLTVHTTGNSTHQLFFVLNPTVSAAHNFTSAMTGGKPTLIVHAFAGVISFDQQTGFALVLSAFIATGALTAPSDGTLFFTGFCGVEPNTGTISVNGITPHTFSQVTRYAVSGVTMAGATGWAVQSVAGNANAGWSFSTISEGAATMATFIGDPAPVPAYEPGGIIDFTIGGNNYPYRLGTLRIIERANGRGNCNVELVFPNGDIRPEYNSEIIAIFQGEKIFAGLITVAEESGINDESAGPGLWFHVDGIDYRAYAERRHLYLDYPSQQLKTSLTTIVDYLEPYGITLDGSQVDGPVLPDVLLGWTSVAEALNNLTLLASSLTGPPQAVVWEIDYDKILRAYGVLDSGHTAPFNITEANLETNGIILDVRVRPSIEDYANYILLFFGTGQQPVVDFLGTGNGVATQFSMHYPMAFGEGRVNVGGTLVGSAIGGTISGGTDESLGLVGSGADWEWNNVTNVITRTLGGVPNGDAVLMPYTIKYPALAWADAGDSIENRFEVAYVRDDILDYDQATAAAQALLQQTNVQLKEVIFTTTTIGCHPGQTIEITLPRRNLSGIFTIVEVEISDIMETRLTFRVTAFGGTASIPTDWRDTYRKWSGTQFAGSIEGTGVVDTGGSDIAGPGPTVDGEIVLWNATTGTSLKRATGTGYVHAASGVYSAASLTRVIAREIGDGVNVISTGVQCFVSIPATGTITKVRLLSSDPAVTSGSIVIDIGVDTFGNYPPTAADSICASDKPTISSATKLDKTSFTGWTLAVVQDRTMVFIVDSVTSFKRVLIEVTIAEN